MSDHLLRIFGCGVHVFVPGKMERREHQNEMRDDDEGQAKGKTHADKDVSREGITHRHTGVQKEINNPFSPDDNDLLLDDDLLLEDDARHLLRQESSHHQTRDQQQVQQTHRSRNYDQWLLLRREREGDVVFFC